MPVPKPRKNEKQDKYISRCISAVKKADPDRPQKQVIAICYSTWRESKKKKRKKAEVEMMAKLTLDDVENKLDELYDKRKKVRKEISKLYKQDPKVQEKLDELYEEQEKIYNDIHVYLELRKELILRNENESWVKEIYDYWKAHME